MLLEHGLAALESLVTWSIFQIAYPRPGIWNAEDGNAVLPNSVRTPSKHQMVGA